MGPLEQCYPYLNTVYALGRTCRQVFVAFPIFPKLSKEQKSNSRTEEFARLKGREGNSSREGHNKEERESRQQALSARQGWMSSPAVHPIRSLLAFRNVDSQAICTASCYRAQKLTQKTTRKATTQPIEQGQPHMHHKRYFFAHAKWALVATHMPS